MKKTILLAAAVVLAVVFLIGIPIYWKMERVGYENTLVSHFAAAIEKGGIVAEPGGVRTQVNPDNTERVLTCLTRYERKEERNHIRENSGQTVVLTVDSEMRIELEQPDPSVDLVYIYYTCGLSKRVLSIKGYRTMEWVVQTISEEGMYGSNTVL